MAEACASCGAKLTEEDQYCPECWEPVDGTDDHTDEPEPGLARAQPAAPQPQGQWSYRLDGEPAAEPASPRVRVRARQTPRRPPPSSTNRWWIVAVAVLALLAMTGGALAYQNYTTAQDWKDRALATEDKLEQTSADLEKTTKDLAASEEDVDRLEGRVSSLAAEKARVEDQREAAIIEADAYQQLAGLAATVADELDRCITAWQSFTQSLINVNSFNYPYVEAEAERAGEVCGRAKAKNQELTRIINSLV